MLKHKIERVIISAVVSVLAVPVTWADDRPNVLVILADDLGYSDLGCYGGEIPTPNLDRVASSGVRFSSFYTSARCCPSRASLMTGLHPHQAGIGSFTTARPARGKSAAYTGHLLPTCVTLAEMLGDAGYSTWMVGKWHLGIPGPIERGFQNYFGYKNLLAHSENQWNPDKYVRLPEGTPPERTYAEDDFYVTDVFSDYALEFLGQARKIDKPFFLYVAHSSPHFPVQAPKQSIDQHVETYRRGWDTLRSERFERQKTLGLVKSEAILPPRSMVPVDRSDIANGFPGQPNPAWESLPEPRREDLARRMATFAAMVEHVDRGIGRILKYLEHHGQLDNTLIFFLSDNGACYEWGPFGFDGPSRRGLTALHTGAELDRIGQADTHHSYGSGWANLGNTPLNMYKHFCHEGGLASPLIVSWPEQLKNRGAWIRDPAHLMDIVPTILEATRVTYPETHHGQRITPVEGTSLLAPSRGKPLPRRTLAFEHQKARGLRRAQWKITWGKREPTKPAWALYDLSTDRSEQHNLASDKPALLKDLVTQWESWAERVGVDGFYTGDIVNPEMDRSDASPMIANRAFKVVAEVRSSSPHGVVLAQGGVEHGYALHFVKGIPAFDVRVNGTVARVTGKKSVQGVIRLEASLTSDRLSLSVNGARAMTRPSPGLVPVQPKDRLSVGLDDRTAAGQYEAPNPFNGTILSTSIEPQVFGREHNAVPTATQ